MKIIITTWIIPAIVIMIGCSSGPSLIDQKIAENKSGVFTEYTGGPVPIGKSILTIKATLKTHKDNDGLYWFEGQKSPHGKPAYRFALNIDGQSIVWIADGKMDTLPVYESDGQPNRNPYAGEGIKYALDKRIAISPGPHRIFFSLPDEAYYTILDIIVKKGDENYLEMKPIYNRLSRLRRWPSFYGEFKSFKAYYDGIGFMD